MSVCLHAPVTENPHVDVFLAPQSTFGDDDRILRTWRLMRNPLELKAGETTEAAELASHRGVYARLEGPVQPESVTGIVTPLSRGEGRIILESTSKLILETRWLDGRTAVFQVTPDEFERLE